MVTLGVAVGSITVIERLLTVPKCNETVASVLCSAASFAGYWKV